ncbi:MAG: hypothetical protein COT88_00705 [Candidatus Colwellbacteria bacterium CG10_big_fil_rev_8_21_14_0_10_41_28]|uniref:DNA-formamidopyrimidine glycosylase n=1 Tax=Candidatus Colwellbacteria bacterium CG10_big_fil_rev_8_21_14_0_10_41_28 TaxID=1974539 RepID=A0A2H0VHP1_9BACT|nr:MAG: hypothetical protein COT88_00705 [Candidatus Colwellbacteria bacterium CG10_big_fil_rev_8_21_14_0_10_41_28]
MPELPEVHTIAKELNKKVSGRAITDYWSDWPKSIKSSNTTKFKKELIGLRIKSVDRIGKNIVFHLSREKVLLIHQKMTGHLMVGRWSVKKRSNKWVVESEIRGVFQERVNQYIHNIFYLDNEGMIALSDMRKFGKLYLGSKKEVLGLPEIKNLGPDALNITQEEFNKRIAKKKKAIKLTLMDPSVVAGIGNIYADEILWSARVHPLRSSNSISNKELRKVFKYTKEILDKAIKLRGSSVGDYRDASGEKGSYSDHMLVYRLTGSPCKRCATPIERAKAGQRSAHFCPRCQEL